MNDISTSSNGHSGYIISFVHLNLDVNLLTLNAENIVKTANLTLFPALISFAVTIFIIVQLRGILKNVINGTPFSNNSINHISKLGYGIIVGGFLYNLIEFLTEYMWIRMFEIEEVLMQATQIGEVKINLSPLDISSIVIGVFILLLAAIFKYGNYLQEEYDTTL